MSKKISKIGILTGGGDCPGLNAVIRAVVKTAITDYGVECIGIQDGYEGLIFNKMVPLTYADVSGILSQGGTILGTSNSGNPFAYTDDAKKPKQDLSKNTLAHFKAAELDALVCIGGDGTLTIADQLCQIGIPCVGVPKTIDNDLFGTDVTFGFDTAVQIIADAVDRLHTTAQAHHRVMIVETMGRYTGWLALHGGLAGGGDIILIPEIPFRLESVCACVQKRNEHGKRFSLMVVSEGVKMPSGEYQVRSRDDRSHDPIRLGGISMWLATEIEALTGIPSRATILGHLQRGGTPTAHDRILSTLFGQSAMQQVWEKNFGVMVGLRGQQIVTTKLSDVSGKQRLVGMDSPIIQSARSVGTCFGE